MKTRNKTRKFTYAFALMFVVLAWGFVPGCSYTPPAYEPSDYEEAAQYDEYEDAGPPFDYLDGPFSELAFYGDWMSIEPYGWVWRPDPIGGWRPYFHGHWVWTDWGWTWVSYEPFGWAVNHYGFWHLDYVWGWVWIPGREWYPSRVEWIIYDDYIGWAPLQQSGYHSGDPWEPHPYDFWTVVNVQHFTKNNIGQFRERHVRPATSPVTVKRMLSDGPDVRGLERRTGRRVPHVKIKMETIRNGSGEIRKMTLPPTQKRKVEQYKPRIKPKAYKPKEKKTRKPPRKKEPVRESTKPVEGEPKKKKKER